MKPLFALIHCVGQFGGRAASKTGGFAGYAAHDWPDNSYYAAQVGQARRF